jgi:hypothetical protein
MSLRRCRSFVVAVLAVLVTGCSSTIRPPAVELPAEPIGAWSSVLSRFVDAEGRVAFDRLKADRGELDKYVAYIAATRPDSFPEGNERLAYYLNSYNALAMYGVLEKGIPADLDGTFKRIRFFLLTDYVIGGEEVSLYSYENDTIRKLGEPRVHFALNCMSVGCPRLPQIPFQAASLDAELDRGAREFFNSSKYVQVDEKERVVRVSQILEFFTEDFVNDRQAKSLVEFVNRYREQRIPEDFEVEFIPYDWTINRQP